MNIYELPTSIDAAGQQLHIRNDGDWRMVIDVNIALTDPELDERERAVAALTIFYDCKIEDISNMQAALDGMMTFISVGENETAQVKKPKLIDWEEDAGIIISGINGVLKREVRAERYMHWWTFIAAYMAIGDSVLATVVSIRDKIARGKKLEKHEQEFKRENPQYFGIRKRDAEASYALLLELIDG
jgi:hypothetical protein